MCSPLFSIFWGRKEASSQFTKLLPQAVPFETGCGGRSFLSHLVWRLEVDQFPLSSSLIAKWRFCKNILKGFLIHLPFHSLNFRPFPPHICNNIIQRFTLNFHLYYNLVSGQSLNFKLWLLYYQGPSSGSVVMNLPAVQKTQETWIQSLGWDDPLEEEMATHSSILAWTILWT